MLGVVLVVAVEKVVRDLFQTAREEGVHIGGGEGLVGGVGGDSEGLAEEHGLRAEWTVSSRPVCGS